MRGLCRTVQGWHRDCRITWPTLLRYREIASPYPRVAMRPGSASMRAQSMQAARAGSNGRPRAGASKSVSFGRDERTGSPLKEIGNGRRDRPNSSVRRATSPVRCDRGPANIARNRRAATPKIIDRSPVCLDCFCRGGLLLGASKPWCETGPSTCTAAAVWIEYGAAELVSAWRARD